MEVWPIFEHLHDMTIMFLFEEFWLPACLLHIKSPKFIFSVLTY